MIQNNKALKWLKKKKESNKNGWIVVLLTEPNLYLFTLLKKTMFFGLFAFVIYELIIHYVGITQQTIPTSLHNLLGIVLGLLLVFRTNSAHDRWWEARKIFASLHSAFLYLSIKTNFDINKKEILEALLGINENIFYFVSTDDCEEGILFKDNFLKHFENLGKLFTTEKLTPAVYGNMERKMLDMMEYFTSLERIKNTPIPLSYSLHIKISVFVFLLTLPFGMFFALGVWSIIWVMILFFIIAGIEIISNEIENPFRGSPNDLPIDEFKKENKKYIWMINKK